MSKPIHILTLPIFLPGSSHPYCGERASDHYITHSAFMDLQEIGRQLTAIAVHVLHRKFCFHCLSAWQAWKDSQPNKPDGT